MRRKFRHPHHNTDTPPFMTTASSPAAQNVRRKWQCLLAGTGKDGCQTAKMKRCRLPRAAAVFMQAAMILIAALSLINVTSASSSTVTIGSGPFDFSPKVHLSVPPSFVIAENGIRHEFKPFYTSGFPGFPSGESTPVRACLCTLESGPTGMVLTEDGMMEWIPQMDEVGSVAVFSIRVRVIEAGVEIFTGTKTFYLSVLATIPRLLQPQLTVGYEQEPIGWSNMIFTGFQPSDQDRKFFRWSLIDPPPGAYIDDNGGLHWPDDRGFARAQPYTFRIRIDYETAIGNVSDEVSYSRRVLPLPATNNYSELRTLEMPPQSYGMLGFATAGGDGWLVAGEPFPGFAAGGSGNLGRVRLWKREAGGGYAEFQTIQPEFGLSGQAFGASVSLSTKDGTHPTRLAVGAPEASRISETGLRQGAVGFVYVYTCSEDGTWNREVRLEPPVTRQSLLFGGWVSIQGNTLIASMEGMDTAGMNTGALAVFRHDGSGWKFSQMLEAPAPAWADHFSYPADLSDGWIAAAANEDDDKGDNAGAVHLYQQQGAQFIFRQTLHAPVPEPGARFGERLMIRGEWLFVSSFREQSNRGAVQVYRLSEGVWDFHQTLETPFTTAGSAFGVGLSCFGDVLAVSAPGYLFRSPEINGSLYPWAGITLYRLEANSWSWLRQVTECPDSSPRSKTWGYSLIQLSPDITVAAMPDHQPEVSGQNRPLAGRLFMHRWPELIVDPFAEMLASLPDFQGESAKANGDSNQNGVPNVIDWVMGQNPGEGPDSWTSSVPMSKKTFVQLDPAMAGMRFMVPQLQPGLSLRMVIEISDNLIDWQPAIGARWESLETVYFPLADGSRAATYFHPVFIPTGNNPATTRFVRLGVTD